MKDPQLLRVRIELEALISERDGMIAENAKLMADGKQLKFGEGNFFTNAEKMRALGAME